MTNYFRITAYHSAKNVSAIFDSYGLYEKLWQFSAFLVKKGFSIIAVGNSDKFSDGNICRASPDRKHIILRACAKGMPTLQNGIIEINGKQYKPNKGE